MDPLLVLLVFGAGIVYFILIKLSSSPTPEESIERMVKKLEEMRVEKNDSVGFAPASIDPELIRAADSGEPMAQCQLGMFFESGELVRQNFEKARSWYLKAAEQGFAEGQHRLACLLYSGNSMAPKNDKEAVVWFYKAAIQQHEVAQHMLGCMYRLGHGVGQDDEKATFWFRKAAEQGVAHAQFYLASAYNRGEGIQKNEAKGLFWMTKAAEQGHAMAKKSLEI